MNDKQARDEQTFKVTVCKLEGWADCYDWPDDADGTYTLIPKRQYPNPTAPDPSCKQTSIDGFPGKIKRLALVLCAGLLIVASCLPVLLSDPARFFP